MKLIRPFLLIGLLSIGPFAPAALFAAEGGGLPPSIFAILPFVNPPDTSRPSFPLRL